MGSVKRQVQLSHRRHFPLFRKSNNGQPPAGLRFLRLILVLAGCLHLCGGHYGVLQLVAWSGMIVEYTTQEGLIEGARQTFDGKHPCQLCISIKQAKENDHKEPRSPRGRDVSGFELKNLWFPAVVELRGPPSTPLSHHAFVSPDGFERHLRKRPDMPPPRSV